MPTYEDFDPKATTIADLLDFYASRYETDYSVGWGERPALVIVDFSIAFTNAAAQFNSGGNGYDDEVARTAVLLAAMREAGLPVFHTTIAYEPGLADAGLWAKKIPWLDGLREDSPEVGIDPRLEPAADEPVIVKKYPSVFFQTDLDARLKAAGVDSIFMAGCTTSSCVKASVVDAMGLGYKTCIAEDAVSDMNPMLHVINLAEMKGRYADTAPVDTIVARIGDLKAARDAA